MDSKIESCLGCIFNWFIILVVAIVLLSIPAFIIFSISQGVENNQNFIATIDSTFVDGGNTYFVLIKEGSKEKLPYSNEDNILKGKFNSGDFVADLEIGKTYRFYSTGYRVPVLSAFPNIYKYEKLE